MIEPIIKLQGRTSFICVNPVPKCYHCGADLSQPAYLILLRNPADYAYLRALICTTCKDKCFSGAHFRTTFKLNNGDRWELLSYREVIIYGAESFAELKPDKTFELGDLAARAE